MVRSPRSIEGQRCKLLCDRRSRHAELGLALNSDVATWRWSLNGGYTHAATKTLTDRDREECIGRDRVHSVNNQLLADAVATGDLLPLPTGDLAATFRACALARDIASRTDRAGTLGAVGFSRDQANAQLTWICRSPAAAATCSCRSATCH